MNQAHTLHASMSSVETLPPTFNWTTHELSQICLSPRVSSDMKFSQWVSTSSLLAMRSLTHSRTSGVINLNALWCRIPGDIPRLNDSICLGSHEQCIRRHTRHGPMKGSALLYKVEHAHVHDHERPRQGVSNKVECDTVLLSSHLILRYFAQHRSDRLLTKEKKAPTVVPWCCGWWWSEPPWVFCRELGMPTSLNHFTNCIILERVLTVHDTETQGPSRNECLEQPCMFVQVVAADNRVRRADRPPLAQSLLRTALIFDLYCALIFEKWVIN